MIFAIQGNKIVIDGMVTNYNAPHVEAFSLFQSRVNTSLYLDEMFHIFARAVTLYPILLDGRALLYSLSSRPNIGYTLGKAKEYLDPDLDEILIVASCPSSWTHEKSNGVYMNEYEVIKAFEERPVTDPLLEEF